MERRGRMPLRFSARIASRPPSTPTVPSYMPACGMASICEPVPTAGRQARRPSSGRRCCRRRLRGREAGLGTAFQPRTCAEVIRGEDDAGDRRAFVDRLGGSKLASALRSSIRRAASISVEIWLNGFAAAASSSPACSDVCWTVRSRWGICTLHRSGCRFQSL